MQKKQEEIQEFEGGIEMPNDYMALSIAGLIFGTFGLYCLGALLGGLAVFFSYDVRMYFAAGDYEDSLKSAKYAKTLAIIALVLGIIGIISQIAYSDVLVDMTEGYFTPNN